MIGKHIASHVVQQADVSAGSELFDCYDDAEKAAEISRMHTPRIGTGSEGFGVSSMMAS